jgi:hypothetical protein
MHATHTQHGLYRMRAFTSQCVAHPIAMHAACKHHARTTHNAHYCKRNPRSHESVAWNISAFSCAPELASPKPEPIFPPHFGCVETGHTCTCGNLLPQPVRVGAGSLWFGGLPADLAAQLPSSRAMARSKVHIVYTIVMHLRQFGRVLSACGRSGSGVWRAGRGTCAHMGGGILWLQLHITCGMAYACNYVLVVCCCG